MHHVPDLPPMNALEILRETVRILRCDPNTFTSILFLLICPVAAGLLSNAFLASSLNQALARRLILLCVTSGLPLTSFLTQVCHHLAGTIIASITCFPLLISLLVLARSSVSYAVACIYAGKKFLSEEFLTTYRRAWTRIVKTYLCTCLAISSCLILFLVLLIVVCNAFSILMYPPEIVVYPALLTLLVFSIAYAHTIVVCNLASVIAVLEESYGFHALLRSVNLIKGQTQVGLLIFLSSAIGLSLVEGLFEHRVKTLSYGDGSSRIWEGPLLVLMYSFVVLIDSMMSAVFYFTCRSSCVEVGTESGEEEEDLIGTELRDV
ncbi:hypothetical protein LUZ63_005938 [Rhynchospora breviuscula]|uniref:Uncharacterized protein n=1 Tax=Rhynchospora breviuscula TaxID=2022672 RepID=A0A9Q0CP25_9POAL|nr:hypothetical protein LUZ63_005938 [Rhynchospora breviuscula]